MRLLQKVREILKEKNITKYRLEQLTGIYHCTMNVIMNGCKSSNFKTMVLIIRELGYSIPDFFDSSILRDLDKLKIDD